MCLHKTDILLGAALTLCLCLAVTAAAQTPESNIKAGRVVLLNSADQHLPAFVALDSALRHTVKEKAPVQVQLFAETLDMLRFGKAGLEEKSYALLEEKYRNLPVDVVVAYGSQALEFAQHHLQDIWPGSALVFLTISKEELVDQNPLPRTAGVGFDPDIGPTIDLMFKLRPETKRVVLVAGITETDRLNLSNAQASLVRYSDGVEIQNLAGLSLEGILAAVRALPPDASILYVTVFRDGSGLPRVPAEVLRKISSVSPVPIFGIHETYLGEGIVAGGIASYKSQGNLAGEIVARILGGEDPAVIGTVSPVAVRCMADWALMRRWGIPESRLPPDCDVHFREVTLWEHYHWQILTTLAVILAQSFLIFSLVLSRRRLQLAQVELGVEYALRTEIEKDTAILQRRLSRFSRERSVGAMLTSIVHEVSQPIIAIQNYAQAALRRFHAGRIDESKLVELLGKIEGQAERAGDVTQRVRSLISSKEVQMQPTSLAALVEGTIPMVQSEAEGPTIRIDYRPATDLPPVLADRLQIQLVLVNLLSNAIHSMARRGATAGAITITEELRDDHMVEVSVIDEGEGIPAERVQYIFDLLYSDTKTGMGIGLAICQEIISLHGGSIWYEPNPDGGAIFRFTLRTVEA